MAQIRPALITGANAKIKVGTKILAYAVNVAYGVSVDTIPVETMGRYEVVNYEPLSYYISGSLSIIRYTGKMATDRPDSIPDSNMSGNGTEHWVNGHFNPATLINSESVDIEIFQKAGTGAPGTPSTEDIEVIKLVNCRLTGKGSNLSKRGYLVEGYEFVGVLHVDEGNLAMQRTPVQKDLT
jgi:hypothetical protein